MIITIVIPDKHTLYVEHKRMTKKGADELGKCFGKDFFYNSEE